MNDEQTYDGYVVSYNKDGSDRINYIFYFIYDTLLKKPWVSPKPFKLHRTEVVKDILSGKKYITYVVKDGKYQLGSKLHVYAEEFLRADPNKEQEDNLGELPVHGFVADS